MGTRRRMGYGCLFSVAILVLMAGLALAPALPKLDYAELPARASWQLPVRVIDALQLGPGDVVADIGAGDGYFTFRLADAVGPGGRVHAVEVVDSVVEALRREVALRGYENVEVILAPTDDASLPEGGIDLAFVCNVYHHINDPIAYFEGLRRYLAPGGRVVIIEPVDRVPLRWLSPPGHRTSLQELEEKMRAAHYEVSASFDFLPVQSFVVFEPRELDPSSPTLHQR